MITHVAMRNASGIVWALPRPNRHSDVIRLVQDQNESLTGLVEGFLTNTHEFLDRTHAWYEAFSCGQLLPPYNPIDPSQRRDEIMTEPGPLFSENVW